MEQNIVHILAVITLISAFFLVLISGILNLYLHNKVKKEFKVYSDMVDSVLKEDDKV